MSTEPYSAPADPTALAADPLVGTQIGEYRVLSRIGQGGMGVVYAGEQPLIGKKVAIKVLQEHIARDREAAQRFIQEARAVNQIGHRNLIDIFSFGELPDGRQYLVMEFLDGESLDGIIHERAPLGGAEAIAILDDVASGLAAAHAAGILHRDLKPSNIFVVGQADGSHYSKLLDFGLAKVIKRREGTPTTRYGTVLGTPEYMAPEQARGEDLDPRVDVYAFGVIAYEILTGHLPFQGATDLETISKHLTEEPPPPSVHQPIHAEMERLILRMLEKDREKRPATLALVRAELRRVGRLLQSESTNIVAMPVDAAPAPRSAEAIANRPTHHLDTILVPRPWGRRVALAVAALVVAGAAATYLALRHGEAAAVSPVAASATAPAPEPIPPALPAATPASLPAPIGVAIETPIAVPAPPRPSPAPASDTTKVAPPRAAPPSAGSIAARKPSAAPAGKKTRWVKPARPESSKSDLIPVDFDE